MESLKAELSKYGQEHLLNFTDSLSPERLEALKDQLNQINVEECVKFYKRCTEEMSTHDVKPEDLCPVPSDNYASLSELSEQEKSQLFAEGLKEIGESRVGVILLAGGQGTRLGVSYPKGMYDVGLESKKSLFQLQAERILKLQEMAKSLKEGSCPRIVWYIMTSGPTRERTEKYLKENSWFGLSQDQIVVFEQGLLPCFGFDGKILMDSTSSIAMAPDGNGGLYRGLDKFGLLERMKSDGVKYLHVYCVDNCLVRVADPYFVGLVHRKNADCAAKVVEKFDPKEPVGVICQVKNSGFKVVEYSEISAEVNNNQSEKSTTIKRVEIASRPDSDDPSKLAFRGGNIANHMFTVDFLERVISEHEAELVHHVAKKKIAHVNLVSGEIVKPETPNGIKMEKFVFDVFQFSKNFMVWEVPRESEFAPLKNNDAAGKDCPSTSRGAIHALHKYWLNKAGAKVDGGEVEICPLVSYGGENLDEWNGKEVKAPIHIK